MSIQTEILSQNPTVVVHSISGKMGELEAKEGATFAIEIISNLFDGDAKINLILNMKDYIFDNIDSHRIWSSGFKEHRVLKESVGNIAIVGKHSEQLNAEKELMETETLKFFSDLTAASNWLLNTIK